MQRLSRCALGLAFALAGCSGDSTAVAESAAAKAERPAPKKVGYDIRRLRPRPEEKLAAMFDRLQARALEEGKQVAVLFSADWCEPCRQLELELGNMHASERIGKIRILELKEEDWEEATRMNEFNNLRRRWYAPIASYPVFVMVDENSGKIEEMKDAIVRLEGAGIEPTVDNWFENIISGGGPTASVAPTPAG